MITPSTTPKTIVAICGAAATGKTSTLREFAGILLPHSPVPGTRYHFHPQGDISIIVTTSRGKTVAIESQGDPGTQLEQRLANHAAAQADVILCAARTRGETKQAIENTQQNFGYDIIWTSPYIVSARTALVNQAKAQHLLQLLQALGLL